MKHIDTILFPEVLQRENSENSYSDLKLKRLQNVKFDETIEWLNEWPYEVTGKNKAPLLLQEIRA